VLWKKQLTEESSSIPINNLIQNVLLEEKGTRTSTFNQYNLKWSFENELDLIFVAMYLNISTIIFIEEFLEAVKAEFCSAFRPEIEATKRGIAFDNHFERVLTRFEAQSHSKKGAGVPRPFELTKRGIEREQLKEGSESNQSKKKKEKAAEEKSELSDSQKAEDNDAYFAKQFSSSRGLSKLEELKAHGARARGGHGGRGRGSGKIAASESPASPTDAKRTKVLRTWDDQPASGKSKKALNKSEETNEDDVAAARMKAAREEFGEAPAPGEAYAENSDYESDSEPAARDVGKEPEAPKTGIFSFFSRLAGNQSLTRPDIEPVLDQLRSTLLAKNVAHGVASELCESVCASLVDTKQPSFTTLATTVRTALENALTRILTPKEPFELLQSIGRVNASGRPYSIVFIGVNGVGKSTSLAKTAAYLMSKNFKVSITACDTFRSGAIEQLKTHALALGVPLYDRGYDKDASAVAAHGIARAQKEDRQVVLIDTAGRMQDNQPLMVALSKLINVNRPDLVLFVGEALVGNDAVDQLTKFNQALLDLSTSRDSRRMIDGIILTKFDTIDDKVGAAVSMTYSVGAPILFVGVGQTYRDLRKMNPALLIKALLK